MGHHSNANGIFVTLLIAMALVGAALIWMVPSFFDPGRPSRLGVFMGLSALFLLLSFWLGRQGRSGDGLDD